MLPSSWICTALHRINPKLRLAWHGRERDELNDINAGDFALVQLFPAQRVGPLHDPVIYSELWSVSPRMNEHGQMEMVKIDRGPIFNRRGGTALDYDPLMEIPIYIINLGGLGFDKYRVLNGEFLLHLPRWGTSAKKRMKASMEAQYRQAKSQVKDMAGEASDFLWREANKTGATTPTVTWDDARADVTKMYEKQEHRKLESYYSLKDKL